MKANINVGDRVRVNDNYTEHDYPGDGLTGATGVVTRLPAGRDGWGLFYRVRLDAPRSGFADTVDGCFHAGELDVIQDSRDARIEELEGNNAAYRIILEKYLDSQNVTYDRIKMLEEALRDISAWSDDPEVTWMASRALEGVRHD
jgi:hypothetical protein